jgi:hypothetical protein
MYVTVTSLNPLRVYLYDAEALLRFCPQDYHPFDAQKLDSYVIGDDYTPIWEVINCIKFAVSLILTIRSTWSVLCTTETVAFVEKVLQGRRIQHERIVERPLKVNRT